MTREIRGLTGLRAIAWAGILVAHCSAHFAPDVAPHLHLGVLASSVTLFFVLSGFLIYLPFAARLLDPEGDDLPPLRRYARVRAWRIFPAYVVIFVLVDLAGLLYLVNPAVIDVTRSDAGTGHMTRLGDVVLNLTLLGNLVPRLLQTGINPSWTLTVEASFYVVLPLLALATVMLRRRLGGSRLGWALAPAVALVALSVVGRVVVARVQAGRPDLDVVEAAFGDNAVAVLQRSLLVWSDNFGLGMLVCVAYVVTTRSPSVRSWRRAVQAVAWVVVPVSFVATLGLALLHSNVTSLAFGVTCAVVIALMVLPTRVGGTTWLGPLADAGPLHYLGLISFSLYLWHFPVMLLMSRTGWMLPATGPGLLGNILLVGLVSTGLATLTYYGVERPAQRFGHRRRLRA